MSKRTKTELNETPSTSAKRQRRVSTDSEEDHSEEDTENCSRYEKGLGRSIFVVVTKFEGEVYLHIRKYEEQGDKKFPTKTGTCLTPLRWKTFVDFLPEMENCVNMYDHDETVEYKRHLGGNWYVSINKGYPCVDIRKFWLPEQEERVVATRKGIALGFKEFRLLSKLVEEINQNIPEMVDIVPCHRRDDHQNQLGALRCPECNPNAFQNW